MIRKDRILRVADAIEKSNIEGEKIKFLMGSWGRSTYAEEKERHGCGTAACVAGYAVGVMAAEKSRRISDSIVEAGSYCSVDPDSTFQQAMQWFGFDRDEAREVFYPGSGTMDWIDRNADLVPDALRYMVMSDNYHWREALAAARCVKENMK